MRQQGRVAAFITLMAGLASAPQPGFPAPGFAATGAASVPSGQHRLLKRDVGVWDATIQILNASDGTLGVYNGTETNTLEPGGL